MKKIYAILAAWALLAVVGCEDKIDPLVDELDFDRVLGVGGFTAEVRNINTIRLNWSLRDGADRYVVELHEDSLEFNNLVYTSEVLPSEATPYYQFNVALAGETVYSARVKGVSDAGKGDSNWSTTTVRTPAENIFLPLPPINVQDTYVTLLWPAGSEVTHVILNPGNINREISVGEKAAGEVTVEDLDGATTYTATLYNNDKRRGVVSFTTISEANVFPEDDLATVIANAAEGAVLLLAPGEYTVGLVGLTKSITIKGQKTFDKPKLHASFNLLSGATNVEIADLELDGTDVTTLDRVFNLGAVNEVHSSVKISGCYIHDFGPQLIYGNVQASLDLFSVDNSIIANFAGGGDFIDFRTGYVKEVSLTNSTFNNCSPARDFIRLDNSSANFPGSTSNVLIDHCTLYSVSDGNNRRVLYVRFVDNVLNVKNTLIAETDGIYTNQALSSQPIGLKNNYFNAPGFHTPDYVANLKLDISGTFTTLDPGFVNATAGDFTITNETLIDNAIGDPRWRQ